MIFATIYVITAAQFSGTGANLRNDLTGHYVYSPKMSGVSSAESLDVAVLDLYSDRSWRFMGFAAVPGMVWGTKSGWIYFGFPERLATVMGGAITQRGVLRRGKKGFLTRVTQLKDNGKVIDFPVYKVHEHAWYSRYFVRTGPHR